MTEICGSDSLAHTYRVIKSHQIREEHKPIIRKKNSDLRSLKESGIGSKVNVDYDFQKTDGLESPKRN